MLCQNSKVAKVRLRRLVLQKFAPRSKFSSEYKLFKVILQSSKIVCKTDSEVFSQI